jgi:SAM-dependent methyltransferase
MPTRDDDGWDVGATYEEFMGRWSRPVAGEFVRWSEPEPGWNWLDVGSGTGALVEAICATARPTTVVACDPSAPFIDSARKRVADSRVTFEVAGVGSLPLRDGGYDAIVSGLALNFFPDPTLALQEQLTAVRPGGLVGAYVWDYAAGMEFLRHFWDAAIAVETRAAGVDEGHRFPICRLEALEPLFRSAGARAVRGIAVGIPTAFSSFEDYWRPFLGGTGPAPSFVSTLTDEQRRALKMELERRLPIQKDGRIELEARAWAVVGYRP